MSVEHTDDAHPRNPYWEMWDTSLFDLPVEHAEVVMREVRACREAQPDSYVKLIAYDASNGRQTTALSFLVHRPRHEPGFRLDRIESHDRVLRDRLHPYAADAPPGSRYGNGAAP
jgi:ribulose-bisphosphate carboxylase small chain